MKLARGLNMAALAMFLVALVYASVPLALGGAGLALCAAVAKGCADE